MLRTPAPLIGALGLSLKRVVALLAESTVGSRCNGCSLFSRMLEGRRRTVITACVFALLSGLTRALLVPASMAALKSRVALPRVPSGPDKNVGFVILLRARGKERVERISIAGLALRPTGAWEKLWLSHWAKPTHTP